MAQCLRVVDIRVFTAKVPGRSDKSSEKSFEMNSAIPLQWIGVVTALCIGFGLGQFWKSESKTTISAIPKISESTPVQQNSEKSEKLGESEGEEEESDDEDIEPYKMVF